MPGELVTRKQARWMLDHLVTAAVRYGHDMAIVLAALPGESTPEDMELAERRLTDALRDADIISRWASPSRAWSASSTAPSRSCACWPSSPPARTSPRSPGTCARG